MFGPAELGKRYIKLLQYTPHIIQKRLHINNRKIRAYFGGNRSGKTTFGAVETLWWCLGMHRYRDDIPKPPLRARVCCTDFINGIQKIIVPELKKWLPEESWHWHAEARILELENGSTIEMLSYDQDVAKYGGTSRHLIWMDEEPGFDLYQENLMRTVDAGGSILLTMTPIKGLCFDENTEVLSKKGWVNYKDLSTGDEILTLDMKSQQGLDGILGLDKKTLEWLPMNGVYVNENYSGPMIHMTCQGFDALVTPDHKWPVINKTNGNLEVKETQALKTHHKIYRAIENDIEEPYYSDSGGWYKDWFVELAGWFLTDGATPKKKRYIKLYQSETRYPHKCDKIRDILSNVQDWYEKPYTYSKGVIIHWCLKGVVAEDLRILFPTRELTSEFIFRLTKKQQQLLYDSLLDGDGSRNSNGDRFRGTENTVDVFQILCVLLGKRCTKGSEITSHGKEVFQVWVQKENGRYSPFTHVCSLDRKEIDFKGTIWCPHTENDTVIARRNGTVYISHNTWVYDDIYEASDPELIFYEVARIYDNPYLDPDEIKIIEKTLHPDEREVRLEGRFIPKSGLIYKEFDMKLHVVPYFKIPEDWTVVLGIDPHDRNPHAVIFCAINKDNDVFIFDEIYEHCLIDELAKMMKDRLRLTKRGYQLKMPAYSVIDTSAKMPDMISGRSYKEELGAAHGFFCLDAHKNVTAGLSKVREYLQFQNKFPSIFIMEHCRHTIHEFRHYIWDDYTKKDRYNPKETPLKKNDHLLDSLRYVLMTNPRWQIPRAQRKKVKYEPLSEICGY